MYIKKVKLLYSLNLIPLFLVFLVLTLLRTNENSWPFLEPVTEELAPNYFLIIEVKIQNNRETFVFISIFI
jgi:hypothetical protein